MNNPQIIKNVFNDDDYNILYNYLFAKSVENKHNSKLVGKYSLNDDPVINDYANKILPVARKIFNNEKILISYSVFTHYEGKQSRLHKHKDDNACTYILDMCLYQTEPWDIWVEKKSYTLYPNQALAFYGTEQLHWREPIPNPEKQYVGMVFFHFVDPDHWYYLKGPSYIDVIRSKITEEEYNNINNL